MKLNGAQYCVDHAFYGFICCIFPALKVICLLKYARKA